MTDLHPPYTGSAVGHKSLPAAGSRARQRAIESCRYRRCHHRARARPKVFDLRRSLTQIYQDMVDTFHVQAFGTTEVVPPDLRLISRTIRSL